MIRKNELFETILNEDETRYNEMISLGTAMMLGNLAIPLIKKGVGKFMNWRMKKSMEKDAQENQAETDTKFASKEEADLFKSISKNADKKDTKSASKEVDDIFKSI